MIHDFRGPDEEPLELAEAAITLGRGVAFREAKPKVVKEVLVVLILQAITLGIYTPWGATRILRLILEGIEVGGRRVQFRATPGAMAIQLLRISLLSLITCGLYLPFGLVRFCSFIASQTFIDDIPFSFDGRPGPLFWILLDTVGFSMVTLGIYSCWGSMRFLSWLASGLAHSNCRLSFAGNGSAWFSIAWPLALRLFLSLGIYIPWAVFIACSYFCEQTDVVDATQDPPDPTPNKPVAILAMVLAVAVIAGLYAVRVPIVTTTGKVVAYSVGWTQETVSLIGREETPPATSTSKKAYVWEDEKGSLHITDSPPPKGARLLRVEKQR